VIRLILLLCLLATPAQALFFSGTVTGKVTTRDTRADPYVAAGYGAATGGINGNRVHFRQANKFSSATIAVPEALVEVCVILVGNTSCDPQWTRTNSVGDYSVDWWGFTSAVAIFVKVYAIRPQLLEGEVVFSDEIPPHEFRVTTAGFEAVTIGQDQRISPTASLGDTQNISINTAPAAQEVVNTFLTVREPTPCCRRKLNRGWAAAFEATCRGSTSSRTLYLTATRQVVWPSLRMRFG
jgi:hypothetical protein